MSKAKNQTLISFRLPFALAGRVRAYCAVAGLVQAWVLRGGAGALPGLSRGQGRGGG